MQKKLLSLAIASALAVPGAAMADVTSAGSNITIYGKLHASWDWVDNDDDTDTMSNADDDDDNTAVFRNSRLGFKGSEDLGNGVKGIWQVETELDTADDENEVQLRNTYVGLESDKWGKIMLGKHDTPYKTATAKLDLFTDTIADYNNIIGQVNGNNVFNWRAGQIAIYETPTFNGFSGQVARVSYQFDEDQIGIDEDTEAWSAMAKYEQGPFFASVAYESMSGNLDPLYGTGGEMGPGIDDDEQIEAWKIGLGYEFGNSKVMFVYEDTEHDEDDLEPGGENASREAFWGGFSHRFGANEVKLAYGRAESSDGDVLDDDEADNFSIGIDHNFSKRTKVYAIYSYMDNERDAMYNFYSGQNQSGGYNITNGSDAEAFSVGVVHKF